MARVFVIGSINHDIVVSAPRHPAVGETLMGSGVETFPGGKGANQAVAAARANAKTTMYGMVGDDAPGRSLVGFLRSSGVDTAGVQINDAAPTGTALITVAGGDNTIVVVAGANGAVTGDAVPSNVLQPGDVLMAQFETPMEAIVTAFGTARSDGATTFLNPAPAATIPQDLLPLIDYLVVNETEFELTFGFEPTSSPPLDRPPTFDDFAGTVIATLGARGALAWTGGNRSTPISVDGIEVVAVDSTGAGDCFCGYLAAAVSSGRDLLSALQIANRAAAVSVTRPGAASSIPLLSEIRS